VDGCSRAPEILKLWLRGPCGERNPEFLQKGTKETKVKTRRDSGSFAKGAKGRPHYVTELRGRWLESGTGVPHSKTLCDAEKRVSRRALRFAEGCG
jgi:hypothetical protein